MTGEGIWCFLYGPHMKRQIIIIAKKEETATGGFKGQFNA
jgi:hypothetical protein